MSHYNDGGGDVSYAHLQCDEVPAEYRRAATRATASRARDAEDCALLLDALGLTPEQG